MRARAEPLRYGTHPPLTRSPFPKGEGFEMYERKTDMLDITLICVGKMKEKFYIEAAAEYVKRLGAYCKLNIVELPEQKLPQNPTQGDIDGALAREAEAIRAKIPANSSVVALCIEGKLHSSEELAEVVGRWEHSAAKHLVFLIGGSFGMHPSIKKEAWVKLSMSPMTFPHHLARVMLLEQIYRACKIREGSGYHK